MPPDNDINDDPEMAAYDSLPRRLRDLCKEYTIKAEDVVSWLSQGMSPEYIENEVIRLINQRSKKQ